MDLFITVLVGGIVGWLASIVMRTNAQMGVLANVVVGIVGSFLGVLIANAAGIAPRTGLTAWAVSLLGAMALLALLRVMGIYRPTSV